MSWGEDKNGEPKKENLFDYTEEQLLDEGVLTHYQILGIEEHTSTDGVKKAYRKASLKYHPDKTGRGDDDYVFLAVKKAYDVLSDHAKRSTYDSTALSFDDSIPAARSTLIQDPLLLYKDEDFYDLFGPVFQRNLRFDANLRPDAPGVVKKNKNNNNRNKENAGVVKGFQPPTLGDDNTPIEEVHKFYEYWIHFESWRDFTAQAMEELQVENELENAESRFEKRWLQKEVDKRAKQLKTKENGRIHTLVERAMEADPRLRRERQALQEAKDQAKAEKVALAERKKQLEELARIEAERQAEEDKVKRAEEKVAREQEKKQIRKARQQLRKMTSSTFEGESAVANNNNNNSAQTPASLWADSYDMSLDVDYLCTNLSLDDLKHLNEEYSTVTQQQGGTAALHMIKERAVMEREGEHNKPNMNKNSSYQQLSSDPNPDQSENNNTNNNYNTASSSTAKASSKSKPWTKEELSALAKAVKKYPPGGANRWDQISLFVNNICKQDDPRSKEECIQKYNDITKASSSAASAAAAMSASSASAKPPPTPVTPSPSSTTTASSSLPTSSTNAAPNTTHEAQQPKTSTADHACASASASSTTTTMATNGEATAKTTVADATTSGGDNEDKNNNNSNSNSEEAGVWTPEQDQQLQNALAKYPATMDKNARWTAIAESVSGKSKKLCVERFKAIREALKNNRK